MSDTMEGSEQRQEQRRERLEVPSSTSLERRLLVGDAAPRRPRHKPAIKAVPQSGLLSRLQAFLPSLEAANAELEQQVATGGTETVAMERGSDDEREGPYVEMDLACGLFDLKDPAAVAAAEAAMLNRGVAVERYGGSGSGSDGTSDDTSGSSDSEGEEHGEQAGVAAHDALRQVLGGGLAAAAGGQGAQHGGGREGAGSAGGADPSGGSGDAMDHDADAEDGAAEAHEAAGLGAAPGRRRKKRGAQGQRRRAGIVELT